MSSASKKGKTVGGKMKKFLWECDSRSDDEELAMPQIDPNKLWLKEFNMYVSWCSWWGSWGHVLDWVVGGKFYSFSCLFINSLIIHVVKHNYTCFTTWESLAWDYLHVAIMASSVSSERAFSAAGITVSKCCDRLKGDVVEALQFLKCSLWHELMFQVPWDIVMTHQFPNPSITICEPQHPLSLLSRPPSATFRTLTNLLNLIHTYRPGNYTFS